MPATVQAVLAARIDRLPPEEKRLLQTAAVIGKDVPFALLQADRRARRTTSCRPASRGSRPPSCSTRQPVPGAGVHVQARADPRGGVRQPAPGAAQGRSTPGSSPRSSGSIRDRLDEHVERLAHHALRGELWEQAVAYAPAGRRRRRVARSANREAVSLFEQALEALGTCPRPAQTLELAIDLRLDLRNGALRRSASIERVRELLREAEALAEALGDRRRLGRASDARDASTSAATGEHRRAVEVGQRALAHCGRARRPVAPGRGGIHSAGRRLSRRGELPHGGRLPPTGRRRRSTATGSRALRPRPGPPAVMSGSAWPDAERAGRLRRSRSPHGEEATRHRPRRIGAAYQRWSSVHRASAASTLVHGRRRRGAIAADRARRRHCRERGLSTGSSGATRRAGPRLRAGRTSRRGACRCSSRPGASARGDA